MQDNLIIGNKIKKTILYIEVITDNYPKSEYILKNKIIDTSYNILEHVYRANIFKDINYMKEIIVNIRILEFYIKKSLDKKLISYKKFDNIGTYLLEINKMINSWIKYEKSK